MKNIQNIAAAFFIVAISILAVISIMGVWEFFDKDVISKSFQTLGLLAFVAVIIMAAGRFIEHRSDATTAKSELPSPMWKSVRTGTLSILIVSVSLLALLGVLSIWEVFKDKDILYKSLGSLGILAFCSFIIAMTCIDREGKFVKSSKGTSWGSIIALLILLYFVFSFLSFLRSCQELLPKAGGRHSSPPQVLPDDRGQMPAAQAALKEREIEREAQELGHDQNDPGTASNALLMAANDIYRGKDAKHEVTSRRMLAWAAETEYSDVAERVAKLACLRPIGDAKMQEATLNLARKAVELCKQSGQPSPWQQMTLGMAEYRSGHYQEAENALSAVAGMVGPKTYRPGTIQTTADCYRAMSLFQLGRKDEARALLTTTGAEIKTSPAHEKKPLAEKGTDHNDLVLWLAYREAKGLLFP